MPNLRSCDKGNMRPNSKSYDYKSYSMTPSTALLKSAPLIYAVPDRNQYLVSTLNNQALASSNLILQFGKLNKRVVAFGIPINCSNPLFKIDSKGNLKPVPSKVPSKVQNSGIKQIQVDNKGRYYYNYGKRNKGKVY